MTASQAWFLRRELHGRLDGRQTAVATLGIASASALLGLTSWVVWALLDGLLGEGLIAQIISVGGAAAAGLVAYWQAVLWMGLDEAPQIRPLVRGRTGRCLNGARATGGPAACRDDGRMSPSRHPGLPEHHLPALLRAL